MRRRLSEDLADALKTPPRPELRPELGLEVVLGVVLQVAAAIGDGRLDDRDRPEAVESILAAIGVRKREAASIVGRLARVTSYVPRRVLDGRSPANDASNAAGSP